MAQTDPYYDIRDKLNSAVDKIDSSFESAKSTYEAGKYTPALVSSFKSVEFDLKHAKKEAKSLRKVVAAVEERREVFSHITEAELSNRKKFVNQVGGRIKNIEKYVETALAHLNTVNMSTAAPASNAASSSNQASTASSAPVSAKPKATVAPTNKAGHNRAALMPSKNQPVAGGGAKQMLKNRQTKHDAFDQESDEVLADMSVILDRLAGTSSNINESLVRQADLIDETNNEMTSTESLLELNLNKMDVILKKSKAGRLCTLIILILIAVGMFFLILYV